MREVTKFLRALSDESRLRVLNLLQERECCVCEVMQVMGISQSKASRILSALHDVGLLTLRRDGRWALYAINEKGIKSYEREVLTGILQGLRDNPVSLQDRERLKQARRVGPDSVSEGRVAPEFVQEGCFQGNKRS
jgi:ArsR family transcriptional regulator